MIGVAFVCLGNICRSPTAELVFKRAAEERGIANSFCVSSFGTSEEEEGNPIYPHALKTLRAHGIAGEHRAKQLTLKDVINNDYILVMDGENLIDVLRLTGGKFGEKIFKLGSFLSRPRDIDDPWYTRDFERAFCEISEGCNGFMEYLLREKRAAINYDLRH